MSPPTRRRGPRQGPLTVVSSGRSVDMLSVPRQADIHRRDALRVVPAVAFLVTGRRRPRVVLIVVCPFCHEQHEHVGSAGKRRATCGRGRYLVSMQELYRQAGAS